MYSMEDKLIKKKMNENYIGLGGKSTKKYIKHLLIIMP